MVHAVFIGDITCDQFDVVLDAQPSDVVKIGIAVPFDQPVNTISALHEMLCQVRPVLTGHAGNECCRLFHSLSFLICMLLAVGARLECRD